MTDRPSPLLARPHTPADDFTDQALERGLVAAVAATPTAYWDVVDLLPAAAMADAEARRAWQALGATIEAEQQPPAPPPGWQPAPDIRAAAERLADLYRRRLLAVALQAHLRALYCGDPADRILHSLESDLARVQQAVRELAVGQLATFFEIANSVLETIRQRAAELAAGQDTSPGLPTGIAPLDRLTGGLRTGLHLLAAPPKRGKTSFAVTLAARVAMHTPVLYVTFENSRENLVLKMISAAARVNPADAEQGRVPIAELQRASQTLANALGDRLAFLEGTSTLTIHGIKARALKLLAQTQAQRCLVIIDYLQKLAALSADGSEFRLTVTQVSAQLVDLAKRLDSPILAISSMNRDGYRNGQEAPYMSSLKESGYLEYDADTVMFLKESDKRQAVPPARALDLVLEANRHGDSGTIPLLFRPDLCDFRVDTSAAGR